MSKKKNQIKNFTSDLKFPIKGSNSKFHITWLLNFDKKFTSWPGKEGLSKSKGLNGNDTTLDKLLPAVSYETQWSRLPKFLQK